MNVLSIHILCRESDMELHFGQRSTKAVAASGYYCATTWSVAAGWEGNSRNLE